MDPTLRRLSEELSQAINESLTQSGQIAEVVARIRACGYDVSLVLNATVAPKVREEEPVSQPAGTGGRLESRFNLQDVRFLKSMHISVDEP